jgi:hypothetical protein
MQREYLEKFRRAGFVMIEASDQAVNKLKGHTG